MKCEQYGCTNVIDEDAIDYSCFYCKFTFCEDHIDYYCIGTISEARKRIHDIEQMDIDEGYVDNLRDELAIAEEIYPSDDEHLVFDSISFPVCECCFEKYIENNEKWKKITKKKN